MNMNVAGMTKLLFYLICQTDKLFLLHDLSSYLSFIKKNCYLQSQTVSF